MPSLVLSIVGLLISAAAAAHPGHGNSPGLAHYISEPDYLLGGVAVVLVVVLGLGAARWRARLASGYGSFDASHAASNYAAPGRDD